MKNGATFITKYVSAVGFEVKSKGAVDVFAY